MKQKHLRGLTSSVAGILALLLMVGILLPGCGRSGGPDVAQETQAETVPDLRRKILERKLSSLKKSVFTGEVRRELGEAPAGDAGFAVFLSLSDSMHRAYVVSGAGVTLEDAWESAALLAETTVTKEQLEPLWVKADVVCSTREISMKKLNNEIEDTRDEFFRYGIAFDPLFGTALLEEELNGCKIFHYEDGGLRKNYLDKRLNQSGRPPMAELPKDVTLFRCFQWFCDDQDAVYPLTSAGHRKVLPMDDEAAMDLILSGSHFLMDQVNEDGSFVYGYYPRFDNEISGYNMIRHVSTIWSLLCRYRLAPQEELAEKIHSTIQFAVENMVYEDENTVYLLEQDSNEIKLGANGMSIVAMTEYMDVFGSDEYKDLCCKLGNGILKMMDPEKGSYAHVLNPDFSLKEEHRTVYYDGEATFALSRLYGLTGDQKWLDAACLAVDHFIQEDYAQYRDHWVSYAMNEITKFIPDKQEYYDFALSNAQKNLDYFIERETTNPTCLELLMAVFETYERMEENGLHCEDFELQKFLYTVSVRVNRQLEGYFFPEYAMYMENPHRILNTFMVRNDGFRVRIDDVQHNIGGLYLYCKNYEALSARGYQPNAGHP